MRELNPLVITTDRNGWLPKELRRIGIDHAIEHIPSVRSISSLIWSNRAFSSRVASRLQNASPLAIIANNHEEAILASEIAAKLSTKSAVILRDSYLTKAALEKYKWDLPDHALAVGKDLAALAAESSASAPVTRIYDAITDFAEPVERSSHFPDAALVVGTRQPGKGWKELIEAIDIAAKTEPGLLRTRFVFTGSPPDGFISKDHVSFVGHTENFFERLRQFKLVINPSKAESFGLAPAEAIAAGVPLLSTRTGIFSDALRLPEEWSLPGPDPALMAKQIVLLYRNWSSIPYPVGDLQRQIKTLFSPDNAAQPILDCVARMHGGR
jgi:glycosyltransferase involved in cell wall biosynthesis